VGGIMTLAVVLLVWPLFSRWAARARKTTPAVAT
jgi:hypothetical protein